MGVRAMRELTTPTRVLVADDDSRVLEAVALALRDEGYVVRTAASLAEALALVASETYAFVLTDLFEHGPDALRHLEPLREAAFPTPVGVATAWNITPEVVAAADFACLLAKPFGLHELVAVIAGCVARPLTPAQERHAETVRRFLAYLSAADWDAAASLCAEDVVYLPPAGLEAVGSVRGKARYRAFLEETARLFSGFRCEDVRVASTPRGMAARYTAHWRLRQPAMMSAGLVLTFARDGRIRRLGSHLSVEHLRALRAAS